MGKRIKRIMNMKHRYSHVLEPIKIGNTVLKNHLIATKCISQELQGPENYPAEGTIKFVENLARNGAAAVVCTIGEFPETQGHTMFRSLFNMADDRVIRYFAQMADRVHAHGSLAIGALSSAIPTDVSISEKRHPELIKKPLQGPMGDFGPDGRPNPPRPEITKDEIQKLVRDFARDCAWIKTLGFDGVNVYMCYEGSILAHALSPVLNQRTDEYGGTTENRARFASEIFREIRKTCGRDFIIECQISGEEDMPGGYDVEEFLDYCEIWDREGLVDIFEIRAKNGELHHTSSFSSPEHEPTTLKYARAMKKRGLKALAAPSGGFQNPDDIDRFIAESQTDMVAMARGFISDPEYGIKLIEGRDDFVPCIRCDKCHGAVCSVNPYIGRAHYIEESYGKTSGKKVAVIGGGPAGMKAALVASQRGHKVTLYEKNDSLGGQLRHAYYVDWKWALKNYTDYLINQLKASDVEVITGCNPGVDEIKDKGFDAIIAACGSVPRTADVPGADHPDVMSPIECYGREKELGKNVTVIGGASTGTETAVYLADNGHKVTLISRKPSVDYDNVAHGSSCFTDYVYNHENIRVIVNANTLSIENGRDVTISYDPERQTPTMMHGPFMPEKDDSADTGNKAIQEIIRSDTVVFSAGVAPCVDECYKYADLAPQFFVVGDANIHTNDMWKRFMLPDKAPKVGGDVKHATATAFSAAMSI